MRDPRTILETIQTWLGVSSDITTIAKTNTRQNLRQIEVLRWINRLRPFHLGRTMMEPTNLVRHEEYYSERWEMAPPKIADRDYKRKRSNMRLAKGIDLLTLKLLPTPKLKFPRTVWPTMARYYSTANQRLADDIQEDLRDLGYMTLDSD